MQIVDNLKTIHAVHQFVPYAKSRLAIWYWLVVRHIDSGYVP